jgi:hypothetical protein
VVSDNKIKKSQVRRSPYIFGLKRMLHIHLGQASLNQRANGCSDFVHRPRPSHDKRRDETILVNDLVTRKSKLHTG